YTVHSIDADAATLAIDFALHGDDAGNSGIACAWALSARPGDVIEALGPGGAYSPNPDATRHLLCGDATAIPAIASAIKALPADAIHPLGPGGASSPPPPAPRHPLCGDATAIPAIASAIKALPADAIADVVVDAPDYADVDLLPTHPGAAIPHVTPSNAPD